MNEETPEENEALFTAWLKNVSEEISARTGCLSAVDFQLFNYREAFEEGKDFDEVVEEILEHAAQYR